jgi:hypothetical protein
LPEDIDQDEHDVTDDAIDEALKCHKSELSLGAGIRMSRNSNEFASNFNLTLPSD